MTSQEAARPGGDSSPLEIGASPEPSEDWDRFVRAAPGGSFCHLGGWGAVFREALGLEPGFVTARAGGEIQGILPLVRMPRLGRGHALISVPYLNYGGPLGTREACSALLGWAEGEARSSHARYLEIRSRAPLSSSLALSRKKITVTLELPQDPDILFNEGFKAKLRSQIRRPQKEGMESRFGPDQKDAFYEVFARNMRDLGTPVLPRSFWGVLLRTLPEEVDFGTVYHQGTPVAAGCGFHFRGEFEMTWASSVREANKMAPNMLLYWSFIERCIGRGHRTFNFGRCTPGGGTHRFKSQWGGVDEPLAWLQWPEAAGAASPESRAFALAIGLWRRLPLPVANRLGPVLARRIPTF